MDASPYFSLEWKNCSSSFNQWIKPEKLKFASKDLCRSLFFQKVAGSAALLKRDSGAGAFLWI